MRYLGNDYFIGGLMQLRPRGLFRAPNLFSFHAEWISASDSAGRCFQQEARGNREVSFHSRHFYRAIL